MYYKTPYLPWFLPKWKVLSFLHLVIGTLSLWPLYIGYYISLVSTEFGRYYFLNILGICFLGYFPLWNIYWLGNETMYEMSIDLGTKQCMKCLLTWERNNVWNVYWLGNETMYD